MLHAQILHTLKLLLPAILPSWRFFDVIAPSPRIEFSLLKTEHDHSEIWQELNPKPAHVPISAMLKRIVWNPHWNESLFLVSCAERLVESPTDHSTREILKRIHSELRCSAVDTQVTPFLRFRLTFISRTAGQLQKEVLYVSQVHLL